MAGSALLFDGLCWLARVGLRLAKELMGWGGEICTFDALDEDGEVVDCDSLAAHSELWGPGWEVDGFGDESGDVWEVDKRVSDVFFCIVWDMGL
jgi:hypothetical protein